VECLVLLFGYENVAVGWRIVARYDTLAQASLSRLGETCRNRLGSYSSSHSSVELSFERGDISLKREGLA